MADYLLDTDVCIWHLRGRKDVVQLLVTLANEGRLGISVITRSEILAGMRPSEEEQTRKFLDACQALPVTAAIADRAGLLVASLRASGTTIHLPDALIAATAMDCLLPLFTCNARHYPVDELMVQKV